MCNAALRVVALSPAGLLIAVSASPAGLRRAGRHADELTYLALWGQFLRGDAVCTQGVLTHSVPPPPYGRRLKRVRRCLSAGDCFGCMPARTARIAGLRWIR